MDTAVELERDIDVMRAAVEKVTESLPSGWGVSLEAETRAANGTRVDGIVTITPPSGAPVALVAEVKRMVVSKDAPRVAEQLYRAIKPAAREAPLVIARYLAPPVRKGFEQLKVSYVDATGNMNITLENPLVVLRRDGARNDPWRGPGRPRGTLRGEPAAKVVRALVDFREPVSVPELSRRAGSSSSPTYRVIDYLDEQALLTRRGRGQIETVEWRRVLEEWAKDYGFMSAARVRTFLEPRGLGAVEAGLRETESFYALTGSMAAREWEPYAEVKAAMIYADDPNVLADDLGLREVDTGGNVLVVAPPFQMVYDRSQTVNGLRLVAPSQTAVDLLTAPGRGPAEGEALLNWMEANVDVWRS